MKNSLFSPKILAGFVAVLVGVVYLGWKLSGPDGPPQVALPTPPKPPAPKAEPKTSPPPVAPTPGAPQGAGQNAPPQPAPMVVEPNAPKTPDEAAREAADYKIGTIIQQEATPEAVSAKLYLLFPNFTSYEKVAAAPHMVNLTSDEELPKMINLLKNPLTPPEAMESFFNDMLNRPPELGWPVLIDIIGQPRHPMAEQARELMSTIVGDDFGTDITKWREGLREQLKLQGADLPPDGTAPAIPPPQQ
ncbi:MAG: hypothetical protein JNJ83_07660 [Verrucomicrobiaceae bacterium]|nr:hypothetical protein [Verrucomicrobiaceae bacterium]